VICPRHALVIAWPVAGMPTGQRMGHGIGAGIAVDGCSDRFTGIVAHLMVPAVT